MDKNTDKDSLYTLEGNPGFLSLFPHALQQVLAMFISNVVPLGMVAAAANPALSQEEIFNLTQAAMIAAGIATFIQASKLWKIGSGLPIFMGVSFTFAVPLAAIASKHGYGAVIGTVLVGGLFEGFLGLSVKYWKRLIAPVVSACVVIGIGLSLLAVAARSFGGGYVEDFGAKENIIIGSVTLLVSLVWMIYAKGPKKQLSILIGLAAGLIVSIFLGKADFSALKDSGIIALPKILPYKPVFRIDAIISIALIYLVSATETLGDASAVVGGTLNRSLTTEEMTGVITVDGFGSFISSLLGGIPVTSYSENVGLTIMTKVLNRNVARIGGVMLVIAGLFPVIGRFICTIPEAAIGGMLLIVLGQIIVAGFEMLAAAGFTNRNKLITSVSLSIGIGFTASTEAGIWRDFPVVVQSIFSQNVVAIIFVCALLLNLCLPEKILD